MKYRFLFLTSFILTLCLVVTFSVSNAQTPDGLTDLILTPSSENPSPGQTITITLKSFSIDINSAKITWFVNGVSKSTGTGLKTLEVTAPQTGKKLVVEAKATTLAGKTVSETLTIGSGSIDLILESDGYVPPSYKGKVYPVFQNSINVIAIPHLSNSAGTEYDPKTLVYTWRQNEKVLESDSGYGKQKLSLQGSIIPRAFNIRVTATTRDGTAQASAITSIDAREPSTSFYVEDPQYGPLYNRAVNGSLVIGTEKETTVLAVPFGFSAEDGDMDNLQTKWFIGDKEHTELDSKRSIILRATEGASGGSNIEMNTSNPKYILQRSKGFFSAIFINKTQVSTPSTASFQ